MACPIPSGTQSGERLVLFVTNYGQGFAHPSPWTLIQAADGDGIAGMTVWTKVSAGSEAASVNLGGFYADDARLALMLRLGPCSVNASAKQLGTVPPFTAPSLVVPGSNAFVVRAWGYQSYAASSMSWDSSVANLGHRRSTSVITTAPEYWANMGLGLAQFTSPATAPALALDPALTGSQIVGGYGAVTVAFV